MSVAPEDIHASFNSNVRKYRCCFGCGWHVQICAKMIGALESVSITIAFVSALIGYIHHRNAAGTAAPKELYQERQRPRKEFGNPAQWWKPNSTSGNESGLPMPPAAESNPDVLFAVYTFCFVVVWMVVVLLFYGIHRAKPRCLLPHMFVQSLCVLYSLIMTVVYAIQQGKVTLLTFPARPALIIYSLGCIVQIYFFCSIVRCYMYLKAKRRAIPSCRFEKPAPLEEDGAGSPTYN